MLSTSFIVIQFSSIEFLTKFAFKTKWVENKQLRDFYCGGLAATIGIMCVQPLDVVRTRFVAQGEPKVKSFLKPCRVWACTKFSLIFQLIIKHVQTENSKLDECGADHQLYSDVTFKFYLTSTVVQKHSKCFWFYIEKRRRKRIL